MCYNTSPITEDFLMDGLRMTNAVIPFTACCMGLMRPRTPGIPKYACWSFPDIFWNLLSESFSCFRMDLIIFQISFIFFVGIWMVDFVPLIIHPNISFAVSHVLSP